MEYKLFYSIDQLNHHNYLKFLAEAKATKTNHNLYTSFQLERNFYEIYFLHIQEGLTVTILDEVHN